MVNRHRTLRKVNIYQLAKNRYIFRSFLFNRSSQSHETGDDLYRFEEYGTNRCVFEQKTQTFSKQEKETNANKTCQQRRRRVIFAFFRQYTFLLFIC